MKTMIIIMKESVVTGLKSKWKMLTVVKFGAKTGHEILRRD